MQDCLDGYVVCACLEVMGMTEIDSEPSNPLPPLLEASPVMKLNCIRGVAKAIIDRYVNMTDDVKKLKELTIALDQETTLINTKFDAIDKTYRCECPKTYKKRSFFVKHMQQEHGHKPPDAAGQQQSNEDGIANYRSSFMKCAFLLRDTNDAYQNGDGNRIARNAKFEMLTADVGKHIKYRLWLFRFQAYIVSLLSEKDAMEYMWNCTSNTNGGNGNNIPNDNLVELTVQAVKKKIQSQGANATFKSAREAALAMKTQAEIKENLMRESKQKKPGKKRSEVKKPEDIRIIVKELQKAEMFKYIAGRNFVSFPNFREIFSRVKMDVLYKWITTQKNTLWFETE